MMDGAPPEEQAAEQPGAEATPLTLLRCVRRARKIALKAKRDQAVARGDWTSASLAHQRMIEHEIQVWRSGS